MQTQTVRREDRMMANSYREFSRKRYTELKEAHKGRMRETEIIQKIIREWDDMKMMSKKGRPAIRNLEPPATPMRDDRMMEIDVKIKSKLKSTSAKKEEMGEKMKEEMMMVNVQPFDAAMDMPMNELKAKTKMIKKEKKTSSYISFYKENFALLRMRHPTWTSIQITQIIKLMWHREKNMRMNKMQPFRTTPAKIMTGRMFFKRFKMKEGMSADTVKRKWKRLPMDSKRMYECSGNPQGMLMKEKETGMMMMTRSMKMMNSGLSYMLMKK